MTDLTTRWHQSMQTLPLVAILRGLKPDECLEVGQALIDAGFSLLEVPLNSPQPFKTLERLCEAFGDRAIIGAGTVLTAEQATQTIASGCELIVAPNLDPGVANVATQHGKIYCPGVMTPTEAFSAIQLGASALKLFPAEMIPPHIVKAMSAVMPDATMMLAVGGITPANIADYCRAGAAGFGIGSALYHPGKTATQVGDDAVKFVAAWKDCQRTVNQVA